MHNGKHFSKSKKNSLNPFSAPPPLPSDTEESSKNAIDKLDHANHGEGSYQGTLDYQQRVRTYLETADVEKDAHDAAPTDDAEAAELENAETEGRSRAVRPNEAVNRKTQ